MGTQTQWGPRTYGNRTNNTWQEKVCDSDGSNCRTETYYVTVQDPGDGGPFGASGDLAGKTTIYKRNDSVLGWLTGQAGDVIVGEIPAYGPNKGKLIRPPNVAPGSPLDKTITHFSEPENLKRVKNQTKEVLMPTLARIERLTEEQLRIIKGTLIDCSILDPDVTQEIPIIEINEYD